jgi:hypothetical protein
MTTAIRTQSETGTFTGHGARLLAIAVALTWLGAAACRRPTTTSAAPSAAAPASVRGPGPHHGVRALSEGNEAIERPAKLWSREPLRELSRNPGVVFHIVADAEYVYSALENGKIRRAPKNGGASTVLTSVEPKESLYYLAQDVDSLYYARATGVYRLAKTGGAPQALVLDATPDPTLREQYKPGLAVDGQYVYYGALRSSGQAYLARVAKRGGKPIILGNLEGDVQAIAVDSGDSGAVYWASLDPKEAGFGTSIRSMPKTGGAVKVLADRGGFFARTELRIVGDDLVWADAGLHGAVASVPKRGGKARVLATSARGVAPYLAFDGSTLFWAEGYSRALDGQQWGLVMSVSPAGGPSVAVTSELKQIGGLSADRSGAYVGEGFSSEGGTQLWGIAPG